MRDLLPLAALALGLSGLLSAQVAPLATVRTTENRKLDFPAGGTLHIASALGEVSIEAWDQPGFEMVVTRSVYGPQGSPAAHQLDQTTVQANQKDKEVVVTSTLPLRQRLPFRSAWKGGIPVAIDYRIYVPRDANLVIDRGEGEVHIEGLAGNVRVVDHQGEITIRIPDASSSAIDAKTRLGDVLSDFPGTSHRRRWIFAHEFTAGNQQAARTLYLRSGFGDIIILKQPPAIASTRP